MKMFKSLWITSLIVYLLRIYTTMVNCHKYTELVKLKYDDDISEGCM